MLSICYKNNARAAMSAWEMVLLLWVMVFGWGCAGTSQNPGPAADMESIPSVHAANLRKKVALAPIQIETAFAHEYTDKVIEDALIIAVQKECPEILWLKPGDSDFSAALAQLPRLADNRIDNFELANMARMQGLNAVVVVTLTSISADEKPWGYWFFKRTRYYARAEILIDVFDTETATKLINRTVGHTMKIDALEMELIRSRNRFENYLIEEIIEEIVEEAHDLICTAIDRMPWKSYIRASGDGSALIASGKRSGLRPGHVLEVFDSSAVIDGIMGHRYYLPGQKIGEVKIKSVSEVSAQAVSFSDQPLPVGSLVKVEE